MPLRSDWSEATCPIARSLDVVGDPWVLLVLREAFQGVTRYDEFRARLGVADSVLAKRLAGMVDAGLLERTPYRDGQRTRDGYVLTDAGADLLPLLNALVLWGERHRPRGSGVMHVVHDRCGRETASADTCTSCGEPLSPATVSWRKPRDPSRLVPLVR
ncbi:winged helix-turn-helix transcriptional regulator [Nocardioides iriomotensis]|uniref:Transcriptional regulator n=1 Tax=Nocardioides iriomotensis TaxID=715784 RepID=A0A4Q5J834_9ACTN|nr:helix-turn-helix domain-containing protein [Nocardioides iriomotensis]RYU13891.1 transcriptional regulator [Nocardioides iriomotensis]